MGNFISHRVRTGLGPTNERGQATIALVGVIALAVLGIVALSILGQAMIHRARAANAADAVALAAAVDPLAAEALQDWYRQQNIIMEHDGTQTIARSGPSQAAAWASTQPSSSQPAPVLVAIVARAEQLLNTSFTSIQWQSMTVMMSVSEATNMRVVAAELGLCEDLAATSDPGFVPFQLC